MKTYGIFFLAVLFTTEVLCQKPSLEEVRSLFKKAATEKEACTNLTALLEPVSENDPLLYGYKGAALMISAKYPYNPFKKLSRFKEGKQILDSALSAEKESIELRYLRFAIQKNTPSFLGYNQHIEEDRSFLRNALRKESDLYLNKQISEQLK